MVTVGSATFLCFYIALSIGHRSTGTMYFGFHMSFTITLLGSFGIKKETSSGKKRNLMFEASPFIFPPPELQVS